MTHALQSVGDPFYGRTKDLEFLRHGTRLRSATLVYGDSGIGKSAILQRLRDEFSAPMMLAQYGSDVLCGFYECSLGDDKDLLVRTLDSFLTRNVLNLNNWQVAVKAALAQSKANLKDPQKLAEYCAGLGQAVAELPAVRESGKASD